MRAMATLCLLLSSVAMCDPPDPEPSPTGAPTSTCDATPSHTSSPTVTLAPTPSPTPGQPSCATSYPDAETPWSMAGTTTWSVDGGPSWTTSMLVSASGDPCAPWPAGWGYVAVTLPDGTALAPAAVPLWAEAEEWDPSCPDCSAVWRVVADPEGVVSDPDEALALLPASWLEAWTSHRQGVGRPEAVGDPVPVWWDMPSIYPPGHEEPGAWEVGYYATESKQVGERTYPVGSWTLAPSSYWPRTGITGAVWSFGGVVHQRDDGTLDWDGTFLISAWISRQAYNAGAPPACSQPVVGWGILEAPDDRAKAACPSCTLAHRLSMTQTVIPLPGNCPKDPDLETFARLFGGHHFAYQPSPPAIWTDFSEDLSYAQTLLPVALD